MADPRVDTLVNGCLLPGVAGATTPDWVRRAIDDGLAGVALYGSNAVACDGKLERLARPLRELRDDLLVALDEEGGDVTRLHYLTGSPLPGNLALGVVDDVELTRRAARSIAAELAEMGVNLDFAPVVDVNADPENPVIGTRSFGADPQRVAAHGAAFVAGLQSCGIAASAKHFPGHGATRTDSHAGLPTIDGDVHALRGRELPPFVAAIEASVRTIMTAHIVFPAIDDRPATLSRRLVTGLLRDELGYDGVVITDALEMKAISETWGLGSAAVAALAAGVDVLLFGDRDGERDCEEVRRAVAEALRTGDLALERLEEAADRVRRLGRWTANARPADADDAVGIEAARRALRVEGALPLRAAPFVVQLRDRANLAVGDAHWSLADALGDEGFLAGSADVDEGSAGAALPANGPLVIVCRDAYRSRWQREWLARMRADRPESVVVALGMPDDRSLAGDTFIATFGAGRSNTRAAAEALSGR